VTKPGSVVRSRRTWSSVAVLASAALALSACSSGGGSSNAAKSVVKTSSSSTTAGAASSTPTSSAPAAPTKPVHIKLRFSDGSTFGVGIPVIALFSRKPTNGAALANATTVTVNGAPAKGAWFFESSAAEKGYPVEAHFRLAHYWPAHATIHVAIPVKGLSAGPGLAYDDSLTSDFATGAAHIITVDDSTHQMTVTSDGHTYGTFPVSLGASNTPTARGTKVIMEKGTSICMSGPGYNECGVKWTQRLTYGGEYLHSAPWNLAHIGSFDSSNGCTNLRPTDAQRLYGFLGIGDVVIYPNASGPKMQLGQGYGDWNVPWPQWLTGGIVPMHA
jgi:lipoprotein-anchoring transpeptidase ErfK/SrfK